MTKLPVRLKAVVYSLSPNQQKVMVGLWHDFSNKMSHKISENWLNAILFFGPLVGTYAFVHNYKEEEKLRNRY
nr:cytochrome b-c1 complex subunit 8 protein [Viscum album]